MPIFGPNVTLTISGSPFPIIGATLMNSLCEPVDTLQITTSDLSAIDLRPYNPVTFTCFNLTYQGYVANADISFPPGNVTLSISDELKLAQDYWELGEYIGNGLYIPIQPNNQDVSYWFNYWCDRIGMKYVPATTVGATVPPTVFWQNLSGLDVFRQLTSYAGNGYQVKADEDGFVNFTSYNHVEQTGELPIGTEQQRTVSDDWTRNEVIIYYGRGTLDQINYGSDIPYSFLKKRAIIDSPLLSDVLFATQLASDLLTFYGHFTDIWHITSEDLTNVYEPGVNLGGKLLVTNNLHIDNNGIMQHMIFDRFCPNMWGAIPGGGVGNGKLGWSTLSYHPFASTGSGLCPYKMVPATDYYVHGVFVAGEINSPVIVSLYEDGVEMNPTIFVSTPNSAIIATYKAYTDVRFLAGHTYQMHVDSVSTESLRVGWKYSTGSL